ncbi:MAG: bifunctional precorrin-2 dehydrogenase/sirohydrochlorin ferrochelatase [Candidatus Symbiothrix sp.]|jgi:siroheme synthase-like protein|nr:bifunctional precorrin-2 dehydrogenase/sirohydrochlorin ferrochelatase [Candidatus Symbiothrix sp.]
MRNDGLTFLPISVNITRRKIMIIGGGKVGYHKASILHRFTSEATVVSPQFHKGFDALPFVLIKKEYEKKDIEGAFLIYVCTENEELNARIKKDAESLGILTSVCDNPTLCDFISPAIYKQENITIAVSSNAQDVRLSVNIRDQIRNLIATDTIKI